MRTDQKQLFVKMLKVDALYLALMSLMLIDNLLGKIVAVVFTVYIAVIWATLLFKWSHIVEEMYRLYRHTVSKQLFVLNVVVAVIASGIIFFAPIDKTWSGIMFGLYMITTLMSAKIFGEILKENL